MVFRWLQLCGPCQISAPSACNSRDKLSLVAHTLNNNGSKFLSLIFSKLLDPDELLIGLAGSSVPLDTESCTVIHCFLTTASILPWSYPQNRTPESDTGKCLPSSLQSDLAILQPLVHGSCLHLPTKGAM